jgi:hypothetical protein
VQAGNPAPPTQGGSGGNVVVVVVGAGPLTAGVQTVEILSFSSVRVPKPSLTSSDAGGVAAHLTR